MSTVETKQTLSDLAVLYVAMARSVDDDLTSAKLDAVTDNLHGQYPEQDRAELQNVVLDIVAAYASWAAMQPTALQRIRRLREQLSSSQKTAILTDLQRIARADGVVLDPERDLLSVLADMWDVDAASALRTQPLRAETAAEAWDVLHDLAFIYLVLAHGTDGDLSNVERQVMLHKLQEWDSALDQRRVRRILDRSMKRYAEGADEAMLAASIEAVKAALPAAQRRAALKDLIQIANADGVFLDSEEDLINELMLAWDVEIADEDARASKTKG